MVYKSYKITPVPYPRLSRGSIWVSKRGKRFMKYAKRIRAMRVYLPKTNGHVIFILPMPKSWSDKKKEEMNGKPHRQTPDLDNLMKGLADAVFYKKDDKGLYDIHLTKKWGTEGQIIIGD